MYMWVMCGQYGWAEPARSEARPVQHHAVAPA